MLGDPLRARIIELLAEGPACTCHLMDDAAAKQPTVSHHLRALREAGLVAAEPRGRFTYYRLLPEGIQATAEHLAALASRARVNARRHRDCG